MFSRTFQGGDAGIEIFSPAGTEPLKLFRVSNPNNVTKIYDRTIKGNMVALEKESAATALYCPKHPKQTLGITQPLLVIQMQSSPEKSFWMELVLTDSSRRRRRFYLSTSQHEIDENSLHVRLPWLQPDPGRWTNVIINMRDLVVCHSSTVTAATPNSGGLDFLTFDSFVLHPVCRLRKIFTLPMQYLPSKRGGFGVPIPHRFDFPASVKATVWIFTAIMDLESRSNSRNSSRQNSPTKPQNRKMLPPPVPTADEITPSHLSSVDSVASASSTPLPQPPPMSNVTQFSDSEEEDTEDNIERKQAGQITIIEGNETNSIHEQKEHIPAMEITAPVLSSKLQQKLRKVTLAPYTVDPILNQESSNCDGEGNNSDVIDVKSEGRRDISEKGYSQESHTTHQIQSLSPIAEENASQCLSSFADDTFPWKESTSDERVTESVLCNDPATTHSSSWTTSTQELVIDKDEILNRIAGELCASVETGVHFQRIIANAIAQIDEQYPGSGEVSARTSVDMELPSQFRPNISFSAHSVTGISNETTPSKIDESLSNIPCGSSETTTYNEQIAQISIPEQIEPRSIEGAPSNTREVVVKDRRGQPSSARSFSPSERLRRSLTNHTPVLCDASGAYGFKTSVKSPDRSPAYTAVPSKLDVINPHDALDLLLYADVSSAEYQLLQKQLLHEESNGESRISLHRASIEVSTNRNYEEDTPQHSSCRDSIKGDKVFLSESTTAAAAAAADGDNGHHVVKDVEDMGEEGVGEAQDVNGDESTDGDKVFLSESTTAAAAAAADGDRSGSESEIFVFSPSEEVSNYQYFSSSIGQELRETFSSVNGLLCPPPSYSNDPVFSERNRNFTSCSGRPNSGFRSKAESDTGHEMSYTSPPPIVLRVHDEVPLNFCDAPVSTIFRSVSQEEKDDTEAHAPSIDSTEEKIKRGTKSSDMLMSSRTLRSSTNNMIVVKTQHPDVKDHDDGVKVMDHQLESDDDILFEVYQQDVTVRWEREIGELLHSLESSGRCTEGERKELWAQFQEYLHEHREKEQTFVNHFGYESLELSLGLFTT